MMINYGKILTMMHQDEPVAEVVFSGGVPIAYQKIYDSKMIPIGTIGQNDAAQKRFLGEWFRSRAIPSSRPGIAKIEEKLGTDRTKMFLLSSGISLTDTYWFRTKEEENLLWSDINFYQNGFDPVFAYCYADLDLPVQLKSPDFTTDGMMEKFWTMPEEIPYLVKIDQKTENVLCANEVVFYQIVQTTGVDIVPYDIANIAGIFGCICPDFIKSPTMDTVTALQHRLEDPRRSSDLLLQYLADQLGYRKQIEEMMTLDCIFHNKDRHEKNFGILYRGGSPQSFIPLFDHGGILGGTSAEYVLKSGELPRQTDADLMIVPWGRSQILEQYGCELNIDEKRAKIILQSVYERFKVPEILHMLAERELEQGLQIYYDYLNKRTLE